jgi:hypothetical protein
MLERRKREYHAIHPKLNAVTGNTKMPERIEQFAFLAA